jgi:hypothetical protein
LFAGPVDSAAHIYDERSPIKHTGGFSCPVILFQGLEDKVAVRFELLTVYNIGVNILRILKMSSIPALLFRASVLHSADGR